MDYEFLDAVIAEEEINVDTAEVYCLSMDGKDLDEAYIEL
jgi:hypothetical protein